MGKKNRKRLVWGIVICALVAGLIPYRFRRDKETDDLEIRSLLWGVKKFTADGKQHLAFAMPSSQPSVSMPVAVSTYFRISG